MDTIDRFRRSERVFLKGGGRYLLFGAVVVVGRKLIDSLTKLLYVLIGNYKWLNKLCKLKYSLYEFDK